MKLKATIISLVCVLLVAGVGIGIYCAMPAIKGTIDGSKYYTADDVQSSYDKGYQDGCKTETELTGQVQYYKEIVDDYYVQVNTLNDEIALITQNNTDYHHQIASLTEIKTENERIITSLQTTVANNNTMIASLERQITVLQETNANDTDTITSLNNQVNTLQNSVTQLQNTNDLNLTTINNLSNQITALNAQITSLTAQITNNNTSVSALEAQIEKLQASVNYYEQYIANLENDNQIVATFEFAGSIYSIQVLTLNNGIGYATIVDPTSTDYLIFNGWTVDGVHVDVNTYAITQNTKFVADVTYKYAVTYVVDGETVSTQIVTQNADASVPDNPQKDGYVFDGWTIDGLNIVTPGAITTDVTYTAVFTQLHPVTFIYEDETVSTQVVRNGEYANNVVGATTAYKVFNGWRVNGAIVNVANYNIVMPTTFMADITYKYDVLFKVDDNVYNSQIVTYGTPAVILSIPQKTGYDFLGWSLDKTTLIDTTTYLITDNTTYYAVFKAKTYTVTFMVDGASHATQSVAYGTAATPLTVNKTGYNFLGWSLNNIDVINTATYNITGDTTYYAMFEVQTFTVTFIANGMVYDTQTVTYGGYAKTPTLNPTKSGVSFSGWWKNGETTLQNASTVTVNVANQVVTSDVTYSAVWYSRSGGSFF